MPLPQRSRTFGRRIDFMMYGDQAVSALDLDTSRGIILYLEDITVSFDGFKALNGLTLYIDDGELRCIIGPNGAGKTTLMDVITGKTRPDKGSAFFGQTIDLLHLSEPEIAQVLASRERLVARCRELVNRANAAGGADNVTVVIASAE